MNPTAALAIVVLMIITVFFVAYWYDLKENN